MGVMLAGRMSRNDFWDLLWGLFSTRTRGEPSKPLSSNCDSLVARQAVDAAARNALLEIHFRDIKIPRRTMHRRLQLNPDL